MARTGRTLGDSSATGMNGGAVIGRGARVRGRVSGDGGLLVEGSLEGDVTLRGDLTVLEGAKATSNVDADAVTIGGELEGDVNARGVVRIESGARVRGDVRGEQVSIEDGAEFAGRLHSDFDLPPELSGADARSVGGRRR